MADRLLLRPAGVVGRPVEGAVEPDVDVAIEDGLVVTVGRGLPAAAGARVIELSGLVVAPGFVDLHVHEVGGCGVLDPSAPDVSGLAKALAVQGTTSFLATTATMPTEALSALLRHVAAAEGDGGARCLGVHLEGPWLSPHRSGAQPPAHLAAPDAEVLRELIAAGPVRMVTLAPELPDADELIDVATAAGVVVALGHSDADYDTTVAAVRRGARHFTHCFNAMRPLHHREPGIIGAALDLPDVTVELIADGAHLHPAIARLIHRTVGSERACVVSDCVDRVPRADGVLAGAVVTQAAGVANLVRWGIPLTDVVAMASTTPARVLGRDDLGVVAPGTPADLVALDAAGTVRATWVAGVQS